MTRTPQKTFSIRVGHNSFQGDTVTDPCRQLVSSETSGAVNQSQRRISISLTYVDMLLNTLKLSRRLRMDPHPKFTTNIQGQAKSCLNVHHITRSALSTS